MGETITRAACCPASTLEELRADSARAGFRDDNALGAVRRRQAAAARSGCRCCAGCCVAAGRIGRLRSASRRLPVAGIVGLLVPDNVVRTLHKRHLKAVERGLPDALDMLVICSEAGLGLEPAIDRVGREIGHAHPAVAEELLNVAREMRVNADRRAALMNMGTRTGLDSRCAGSASRWCRRCNTARRSARRCEPCRRKCGRRR